MKCKNGPIVVKLILSRPARGAWIEISGPKQGGWGRKKSRPARGAWIEMQTTVRPIIESLVAPRTGRVD